MTCCQTKPVGGGRRGERAEPVWSVGLVPGAALQISISVFSSSCICMIAAFLSHTLGVGPSTRKHKHQLAALSDQWWWGNNPCYKASNSTSTFVICELIEFYSRCLNILHLTWLKTIQALLSIGNTITWWCW